MFKKILSQTGPGPLIAAAFIGPGTITLCTLVGAQYGLELLWAILVAIIAAIVLQGMAVRLGVIGQKSITQAIKDDIKTPWIQTGLLILIFLAIMIGNTAYEAGNISGGILGLETIFGKLILNVDSLSINLMSLVIGVIAFILLYIGDYKFLEKALVTLVLVMSVSFLITAIVTKPNVLELLEGMFIPRFPEKSLLTIIGLIGTTVVPYNLFLHASLVKERWNKTEDLKLARKDTIISIILGGLVSMAIIVSAAAIPFKDISNAADLAEGLAPLYGEFAKYFLALGLFAAGITSAITAPLAAAYVARGCLGWKGNMESKSFRMVWIVILFLGVLFSSIGIKPIEIIKFAQIANGMLLPVIAGILLWIMNKKNVLGDFVNTKTQNILGFIILAISIFLGAKGILKVFNFI